MLIAQSQATDAGALRYGAPAELRGWSRTRHWMSNPLQAAGYAFRWLIPASVKALDQQSPLSKRCGFLLVASLCAGTVVLVLSQGHAWYHACRNIQSNWYVKKSQESLVQGSLTHAVEWANRAYFASQHNPASIRNMATLATRLRKDEARYLWENLRLEGVMTTDDKVLEIEAHLNCREDKAALMKLESLLRETAPTARMVSLADVLMGRLGKKQELLSLLASYAALHPADPDAKLLLATRKLMFDAGPESPDDVNAVWRLATHNTGTAGLQALEFLDHNSKFDAEDARTLIELLERHPLATAKHRVAALRWRTILQPERKRDLIQEALQKEDDPVPLAQWLNATGEHAAIVEHFGKSLKFDNHPLVEIFLDSLAQLEQEEDYIDVVK